MKERYSRTAIFAQRLMLVICLILTLELLDRTESGLQFSFTQNINLNTSREHLVSLGLYFTSFGIITPLALLILKKETRTP
ncbi:MAG: hypothetical protein WBA77_23525 [Microcoleaceae cyanobacterium]